MSPTRLCTSLRGLFVHQLTSLSATRDQGDCGTFLSSTQFFAQGTPTHALPTDRRLLLKFDATRVSSAHRKEVAYDKANSSVRDEGLVQTRTGCCGELGLEYHPTIERRAGLKVEQREGRGGSAVNNQVYWPHWGIN
jgi:hypothetical protein